MALRTRVRAALHPEVWSAGAKATGFQDQVVVAGDAGLVGASVLFDADWYNRIARTGRDRKSAVADYLARGRKAGLTPHPLFDPEFVARQIGGNLGGRDPLGVFLSAAEHHRLSTHPLFDAERYLAAVPAAADHAIGPVGHYLAIGARDGVAPNDWYVPDPSREPGGLADWIRTRADAWVARQQVAAPVWQPELPAGAARADDGSDAAPGAEAGSALLVSVILPVGDDLTLLPGMVESVRGQTHTRWELLVLHSGDPLEVTRQLGPGADDDRVRLVATGRDRYVSLNLAIELARGDALAWLSAGDIWQPDRLARALAVLADGDIGAVHDVVERTAADGRTRDYLSLDVSLERLQAGRSPELGSLVVRRSLAEQVGGFDESLPAAADFDFVFKLAERAGLEPVPFVGVEADAGRRARNVAVRPLRERPPLDPSTLETWHDVVLNRHRVDWNGLGAEPRDARTVSVIVPTHNDWRLTSAAVRSVATVDRGTDVRVQTIVVDNGSGLTASAVLDSLPLRYDGVELITSPVNHGFALGNNIALPWVQGGVVVFLNNDTEVTDGWLEPLVTALEAPDILGAQSLLVYPTGLVQSAGVAFPACGGIPHALLSGFPIEDAAHVSTARFSAVTAAAMAVRFADVVALRGFDPLYRNGMEDVDFGLRLKQLRRGHFTVRRDSVVVHHESQAPGRMTKTLINRRILLERWDNGMPGDDVELWRHVGYDVIRHEPPAQIPDDRRLAPPVPVLQRRTGITTDGARPALRWAIKNPAPSDPTAEFWGDTHFARQLAAALRDLGQEVVIDHRPAWERPTGRFDDVVVVLRGLAPYRPQYTDINLGWLISHPDMLRRSEAAAYDRLFAASTHWADRMSREWGIRIEPLLQATDPSRFHPDRAEPDTGHRVLFVGGSRRKPRPIVTQAVEAGLPLRIYGREWEGIVPDEYIEAQYLSNDALGAAYRAAGVVLNDHWDDMRVDGFLSNRLFDAAASGARVITDEVVGLGDVFGRSVQVARDGRDLAELASAPDLDAVFGDDAERRAIAARIHAEHSFAVRARQLLDAALEIRAELSDSRRAKSATRVEVA